MEAKKTHTIHKTLVLETGRTLENVTLSYTTYGKLNSNKDNVIWVTHALTGSQFVEEWWSGLFGPGKLFDPNDYFIVCANVLGSCYGSTGPLSIDETTGTPYFHFFPEITIRDMVQCHEELRKHLQIEKIKLIIGGSLGGQQALEWAIVNPDVAENLCVLATNAKHSPWGIAFNATQRMAIENDPTWELPIPEAGLKGLETARAIAMISYRHYDIYNATQKDQGKGIEKTPRAASYQRYQGKKLRQRFNAFAYWFLSKAMDSHDVGRNRGGVEEALAKIKAKTLCLGVSSDVLFPTVEQKMIAEHIAQSAYREIRSSYGHDGFLVETEQIEKEVKGFFELNNEHVKTINH